MTFNSSTTVSKTWDPPHRCIYEQLRGPYRLWRHEHRFASQNAGTQVSDHVDCAVLGGALINSLFVAPDVRRIFDYRTQVLQSLFTYDSLAVSRRSADTPSSRSCTGAAPLRPQARTITAS